MLPLRPRSAFDGAGYAAVIEALADQVRQLYLPDGVPWVADYSGGKDSTAILQLIWHALTALPAGRRRKPIESGPFATPLSQTAPLPRNRSAKRRRNSPSSRPGSSSPSPAHSPVSARRSAASRRHHAVDSSDSSSSASPIGFSCTPSFIPDVRG